MKSLKIVAVIVAIAGFSSIASASVFFEDFESYTAGSAIHGKGGWKGWNNEPGAGAPVSDAYAFSGTNSVEIVPAADLVHEFDVTGGLWILTAMQYIPSGTSGTTWFILLNTYSDNGSQDWSVQTQFNMSEGTIVSSYDTGTLATIVHDAWVEIKCVIDLDNNTVDEYYDGDLITTHQWDNDQHDTLQVIDLYGNGASSIYYDDIKIEAPTNAYNPQPADGAILEATWVTIKWSPGSEAVSHDLYLGEDFDAVNERAPETFRGNQATPYYVAGFPGFAYPEGLVPGTTYYWRVDEINEQHPDSPWEGDVWSFMVPPYNAYAPVPADGDNYKDPNNVVLNWSPGFGVKLHYVYFGDNYDAVNDAVVGIPQPRANYNPGPLELESVYYWRVDEFDGLTTHKGDVWIFTTPGAVGDPSPSNGADDVAVATVLTWTPADNATSHELYFGTNKEAVRSADAGSPEYIGSRALGAESYDTGLLESGTTYFWRVDEVYDGATVKGPVWSFTVGHHLLVDDFENYTDDDVAGEVIWQHWIDGFGVADNGAQTGYLLPPYAEQTIVHSGSQSMPLLYNNEAGVTNSEAALTLTTPRDWTTAGVGALSFWFRGVSTNATEPLYVSIANATGDPAVVAHDDPGAAQIRTWTEWRISLQTFADQGIDLTNVDKIAVGLGSKGNQAAAGGTGTLYIDDIRLYPSQ